MQILVRLAFVFVVTTLLLMSSVVWVAIQMMRMLADIEADPPSTLRAKLRRFPH